LGKRRLSGDASGSRRARRRADPSAGRRAHLLCLYRL
jgi:hypothetical protein